MGWSIAQIDRNISARELRDWIEYDSIQPFGHERDNWHMGVLASILINQYLSKGQRPKNPNDFMFRTTKQVKQSETNKFLNTLETIAKKKHG